MNRIIFSALTLGLCSLALGAVLPARVTDAEEFESYYIDGYYIGGDNELEAFRTQGNGWTSTSSGSSGVGRPATVTWSVVADGTQLPTGLGEPTSDNGLIAFLDGIHHGGSSPGGRPPAKRSMCL